MAIKGNINYFPSAGPQVTNKYQFVGPNYQQYGEQPGFIYDPWHDHYFADPNQTQQYYEQTGLRAKPPKQPGLAETVLPLGATALALGGGETLGKGIFSGDLLSGLFGGASKAQDVANAGTQATQATQAAQSVGAASNVPATVGSQAPTAGGGGIFSNLGSIFGGSSEPVSIAQGTTGIGPVASGSAYGNALPGQGVGGLFGLSQGTTAGAINPLGFGGAGNVLAPAAGAYIGYKALSKPDSSELRNLSQGAASGAAIGSYFGLPGAAIGAGIGGTIGLVRGLFKDTNAWKTESKKLNRLQDQGTFIPQNLLASMPTGGRKKDQLIDKTVSKDFVGFSPSGQWVNNKFANSRDVKDLKAEDVVNYSAFAENDPTWFRKSMSDRLNIANAALNAGAVKEGKGSIKVDFKKFDTNAAPAYTPVSGNPILNPQSSTAPQKQSSGNIRLSPGVYQDPKTGKIYQSTTGKK